MRVGIAQEQVDHTLREKLREVFKPTSGALYSDKMAILPALDAIPLDDDRPTLVILESPADKLPADRRFNPLALNPYVLYKALPQAKKYTQDELVRAMDLLLRCNQRLVSSGLDEALVLQQTLVQIIAPQAVAA